MLENYLLPSLGAIPIGVVWAGRLFCFTFIRVIRGFISLKTVFEPNLIDWVSLFSTNAANDSVEFVDGTLADKRIRFFRVFGE